MQRPYEPDELREVMRQHIEYNYHYLATVKERGLMVGLLTQLAPDNIDRYALTKYLTGTASSKSLTGAQVKSLMEWLEPEKGSKKYEPSYTAKLETERVLKRILEEQGQLPLV